MENNYEFICCIYYKRTILDYINNILLSLLMIIKSTRKCLIDVIKSLFKKPIIYVFIIIIIYSVFVVIFLYRISTNFEIWDNLYFKDIFIWIVFSGFSIMFNCITQKIERQYFKNIVLENIKLIAIVEAITSIYTYSLWLEIVLSVFLFLFSILQIFCEHEYKKNSEKSEFKTIINLCWVIIISIFVIYFARGIYYIIRFFSIEIVKDFLISLLIPLICALLYIPLFYFMLFYSLYDSLFAFIKSHLISGSGKLLFKDKFKIFLVCNVSIRKIKSFKEIYRTSYPLNEKQSIYNALDKVLK